MSLISNDEFLEELEYATEEYNNSIADLFGFVVDKDQGLISIQKYDAETGKIVESVSFRMVRQGSL